jgi:hypothetical protein
MSLRISLLLAVAACAACIAACGGSRSPSPTEPQGAGGISRIELVAPPEIWTEQSVYLRVNAIGTDGRVQDVTSQVRWEAQSFPTSSVLELTVTGLATGHSGGRCLVIARVAQLAAEATIVVLPKGTFKVVGKVTEAGFGVANASVTVLSGVGQGLSASTTPEGEYELYGVAGPIEIGATKDGYFDTIQHLEVNGHMTFMLELAPRRPWEDFRGKYTLTIAGDRCSAPFPEAAKVRVYTADVTQEGARVKVSLSGANFSIGSGVFEGVTTPTGEIQFEIRPVSIWDYDGPDIFEQLGDGTSILIGGVVAARHTPSGLSGQASTDFPGCCNGYMRLNGPSGVCTIQKFDMVRQ